MRRLEYTFKTDTLFKMLFVQNQDLLQKLVAVLMGIPLESIQEFDVRNSDITPEILGEKFSGACDVLLVLVVAGFRPRILHAAAHDRYQHYRFQPV